MSKPWMYSDSHTNAVVGTLVYADENGALLIKIDDYVAPEYVSATTEHATLAMLMIDQEVCYFNGRIFRVFDAVVEMAKANVKGKTFHAE